MSGCTSNSCNNIRYSTVNYRVRPNGIYRIVYFSNLSRYLSKIDTHINKYPIVISSSVNYIFFIVLYRKSLQYSSIITFVLAFWAYLALMIEVVVIGELKVVLEQLVALEAQVRV